MIPFVVCCPGREPVTTGGVQVWDDKREGVLVNYTRTLGAALAASDSGPVTIMEDDVEVPPGFGNYVDHFYPWIERFGAPVQWWWNGRMWDPWTTTVSHDEDGNRAQLFVHRKASKFLSTQAVTYPRALAVAIYHRLTALIPNAQTDDLGAKHSADYLIGRALHEWKRDFLIHWPPVVDHVGRNSMVAPGIPFEDGFRNNIYYSRNNAEYLITRRPAPIVLYPGEYDE